MKKKASPKSGPFDPRGSWHDAPIESQLATCRMMMPVDNVVNGSMQKMYEHMRERVCDHYEFESHYDWEVLPIKAQLALIDAMYPKEESNG